MITFNQEKNLFHLKNDVISYIIGIEDHGILAQVYFGKSLNQYHGIKKYPRITREFEVSLPESTSDGTRSYSIGNLLHEYSIYGRGDFRSPAAILIHEDGSTISDFRYNSYEIIPGKPRIEGLPSTYVDSDDEAETLIITLTDNVKNIELQLYYTIFTGQAIIARSAKFINNGSQTTSIDKISSLSIDFSPRELELLQLHGTWAKERMVTCEKINNGIKLLDSKRGTSSHQQAPFVALLEPDATEFHGEVYSSQLIYSGSHEISVEQDPYEQIRLQVGIQSTGFKWQLNPGESFHSPEAILNFSDQGLNGMSQNYHSFIKEHIIPHRFQSLDRPILMNNWEGTYFDFTEEKIKAMVDVASDLGLELFVLDDGWFGERNDEDRSLGDWYLNQSKLPSGLKALSDYVQSKGMKFGLWFEPEMINENSDLFREHPDYAIQAPDRTLSTGRWQYVLDLGREEVVDNIFYQIDKILSDVPIQYIKWDMNRHLSEVHSLALPPSQMGETAHRYMLGVYDLMERLTTKYPDILFESCSGGGGRFDLGILQYMPQTWTSDDTDAIERLKIQYGTSMMFPLNTMGAHISAVPNHQTGRVTDIHMRGAVAMYGVFGYELDPTKLTESEKQIITEQIAFYKKHRRLFQDGCFTRLISPFNGNETAWMVSNEDRSEHILTFYEILNHPSKPLQVIRAKNLNSDRLYRVTDSSGYTFKAMGDELMQAGFYVYPQLMGDFQARMYHFQMLA